MEAARKYAKVFSIGLQNTVVYRWNFVLRALFEIVPLLGSVFLWKALFASRGQAIGGYDFSSMVFYFLLTILASNLTTPTEDEWQIAADIRGGQINALLSKPLDYLSYRVCLFFGYRATYCAITLPLVAVVFLCFREYVTLPHDAATWFWTGLSLAMSAMIQFFLSYATAMLAFWILEISTLVFIVFSFEYFLSGHMFPLDIAPKWLRGPLEWMPFTYELFFPVSIFLEKVHGAALARGLAIQAGWVLVMWGIGRLLWRRGLRHYGAFGG